MNNLIPYYILEQYKINNFKGSFKAYTMFVDISGFTKLTETLMKHKKDGAEVLTEVLNIIFNPIVKSIYANGGIISTYAGDAFTAMFEIKPGSENTKVNHGIINSALYVNKHIKDNKVIETKYGKFSMRVKVGLSYGKVDWGIIGKGGKNTYYFKGEAIDGCTKSEHNAEKDEIVLDDKIIKQLAIDEEHLIVKDDGYYKLLPETIKLDSKKTKSVTFKYTKKDLQSFIPDSIINFRGKAEFREIVSVFISFDESEKEPVLNEFVIELIEESSNYGGYLNKIDFGDKGGVALILFGAPISHENNIERALNFILQIRKNITDLKFRTGITYGTVYAGIMGGEERCEYTAIGDIVNLSARYMMKAEWNEFWISENIVKKVNRIYEFKKAGDFEFKGKTGEIPVYELIKKKESIEETFFEDEIVGREEELKQLDNYIRPIYKNKFAGIIYVYGEAGIGKSRLVWELKKQVSATLNWFYFPCEEILRKSFNPIIYFLKNYFNISEENSKDQNRQNFESYYNKLLSDLRLKDISENIKEIESELERTKSIVSGYLGIEWEDSLYSQLDARGRYENFLYAVKNMIKAESLIKPAIIELEDTHWIDSDSQKFITILTRNIDDYPIVVLCPSRYNDDGSEFRLDLDKEIIVNKIELNILSKDNVSEYGNMVLNTEKQLSAELLNFIYEKTNGNPFFVEQLLLDMKESNLIQVNKQNELYSDEKEIRNIPSNIQAVVISRLDRLSDDIKQVVQSASVLGREFLIKILTQVLKNEKELDKKLFFIENEKIWYALSEIKYIFKHALLRDAAYGMQLRSRLKALHKFAAESYEEVFKDDIKRYYGDIAYHYEKAEVEGKAIEYLEKAGDYAKENYHNEDAIGYYSNIIDNYQLSVINYIDVMFKKGRILELIGKWNEAEKIFRECLDRAKDFGDKGCISKCFYFLGHQLESKGNYKEAMECYENDLNISEILGNKRGIGRAIANMGNIYLEQCNYTKAMECYKNKLAISQELNDKRGISRVVGCMGLLHWNRGDYAKAMECYDKQLVICEEFGDRRGISLVSGNMGIVYGIQGDYKNAMKCFEKNLVISEELGDKRGISSAVGNIGLVFSNQGGYTEAIECFEKKLVICEELGDKKGISTAFANMGSVYADQGDYTKAMEYFEKDLVIYEELGDKKGIGRVFLNMGVVYKDQGNYTKAMKCYEKKLAISQELGDKNGVSLAVGNMGDVYILQNDLIKAMECYDKHLVMCEELGDKSGISTSVGNMGIVYKKQGYFSKAMECYEKSLTISEELGEKDGIAVTIGNIGVLHVEQGDYTKAMECYEKAISIGKKLNIKYHLCEILYDKADLLFKLNSPEADSFNNEARKISLEIGRKDVIFSSNILKEKINYKLYSNSQKKIENIENLKSMLKDEKEESNIASLNYEIALMLTELKKDASEYKNRAIGLYKSLYKNTPNIMYENRYKELEKLK